MKIAHGSKVQFIRRRNSCRYLRIVPQFKFVTRKMIDNCGSLGSAVHTLLQNCQNVRILKAELPKRHRRRSVYNIMAVHRNGAQLSRKFFTSLLQPSSCLHILLPTYPSGCYNYNSIKICKQISTPPQPYQKIPDIYFLRSCTLTNFISIPSPITIRFVVDVFVLYVILYRLLYCLLCYLVLRSES